MSRETIQLTPELYGYILDASLREPELLQQLREETASMPSAGMQIAADQGQFMAMLIKLLGVTRVIEIGTFTGYSSLAMALALPGDGEMVCCDISEEWTSIARRYWQRAGIEHKINLRIQPALHTLDELIELGRRGTFDFAFIDADKQNYDAYFERCLTLLRVGGLIAVDNVLWGGSVINPDKNDEETVAIRQFNENRKRDHRVDISLVPIGDGLMLLRKIG